MIWVLLLLSFTSQDARLNVNRGQHFVNLQWVASTTPNSRYFVWRSDSGSAFLKENRKALVGTTYHDITVQPGVTYRYYVTADENGLESVPSSQVSVTIP